MSQIFSIHPDNPQARLLRHAAAIVEDGGIIAYPTDSGYALGCSLGNKAALERIRQLRQLEKKHNMTLVCRDLSQIGTYARVENSVFRIIKAFTPGPYTFILNATRVVPRLMLHPKKRTLGIRVPDNNICLALLENLENPLMSTSLKIPGADGVLSEPESIKDLLGSHIDLIINGGQCDHHPTSVIDFTSGRPEVIREGRGNVDAFKY